LRLIDFAAVGEWRWLLRTSFDLVLGLMKDLHHGASESLGVSWRPASALKSAVT
jgi:hypothetical protein